MGEPHTKSLFEKEGEALAKKPERAQWRRCTNGPASLPKWRAAAERQRVATRAVVRTGGRQVELALLAVPLSGEREEAAGAVEELVRRAG